jgi:hypothetical protein
MALDELNNSQELNVETPSEEASPATKAASSRKIDELREFQLGMIDVAQANSNSAFDFARDLVSAKTPAQLMELCSIHAREQLTEASSMQIAVGELEEETVKPNAYIAARPKGAELDPISNFAIEDDVGQVLAIFDTQMEAIIWAKQEGYEALVARVRDAIDKDNPEHWRSF